MARPTRRKTTPGRRRSRAPRRTPSGGRTGRGPLLLAGVALAVAALYALLTLRPDDPGGSGETGESIDDASRAELESVLRDAAD